MDNFFHYTKEFQTIDFSLDRIRMAVLDAAIDLKRLGKVIHIAGTNGKGSTAFFIAQILQKQNFKTALYTSPHIESITERIKLDLNDIEEEFFDKTFEAMKPLISKYRLTFFEALTLIAFKVFDDFNPDFTILETGMGGRLDATNIVDEKIPVITSISQDHSDFLGKNIYHITDEKLAIVKDNDPVFVGKNPEFLMEYIFKKLDDKRIISVQTEDGGSSLPKPYSYNFNLAKSVVSYLVNRDIPYDDYKLPPCRLERIGRFILDGSHNPSGLINTISNFDSDTVIFSCTKDRPFEKMINILKVKFKNIILTEIPNNDRTIYIESVKADKVLKIKNPMDAVDKSIYISGKSDIIIIGSFYLCGYLRKYVKGFCG
ncbi:bifunctional folylpolyglutamate synthase/dihydrofolate synthase [Calditerrivibrio sp.]|uniref:bifunctional folylpolyglutamate synthase/dihydrofolate synthase n=1 Tax=Calditerrivibrio sp. TaxID=2792612 RepID=UPI003D0AD3FC